MTSARPPACTERQPGSVPGSLQHEERDIGVGQACQIVRLWADLFSTGATGATHPGDLVSAVAVVKRYLEDARGDGKPVLKLQIATQLLATREGIRSVMPFVLIAEALQPRDSGSVQR